MYIVSSSDNGDDDDEGEEESDSYLGQDEEEEECSEEEYEDEESESDQEGDVESDGCSDDDEDYESTSEDESDEDDDVQGCDRNEGKLTEEDRCDKVFNLLRQRDKKLDVLKLEECRAYLRKHELMISGTKATCIQRILEHWRLKDGNGERLYPKSSFNINCTGDVCKGDVIMFKQTVYDKFSKVSRNGKVIGKRTIAGRVAKESYGSAKQQHTFTVEVLWSKGVKPLPSLHPLLVKGRNLYKHRTFRQRWGNEAERSRVLEEKHRRGARARHVRATTKATISAGTKRQRTLPDLKQNQIKRLKKHSEPPAPRNKRQKKTQNAKSKLKHSSKTKHTVSSSSANHSKNLKTKTNMRQIVQPESFATQRPNFQNIYGNFQNIYGMAAPEAGRGSFLLPINGGRNIRQWHSVYGSQFDRSGHLSHNYSNYVSQYDARSSGHFFIPEAFDHRK